jgi:hypothetical protein
MTGVLVTGAPRPAHFHVLGSAFPRPSLRNGVVGTLARIIPKADHRTPEPLVAPMLLAVFLCCRTEIYLHILCP